MGSYKSLWKNYCFLRLWAGQTISAFGSQFTVLAIPLIAALVLHATPFEMGLLLACGRAPYLLISPIAGVWVDRWPRRRTMIVADLGRACFLILIPIFALLGHLGIAVLLLVTFVVGIFTVFFDLSYQSYLPSIVESEQLVDGNARLDASSSASQIVGPGLAGIAVSALSTTGVIFLDSLSFLFSALCLLLNRHSENPRRGTQNRRPFFAEVREGIAFVAAQPILRNTAVYATWLNLWYSALSALYIIYLTNVLHLAPALIGVLLALDGAGAFFGAFVARPLVSRLGLRSTVVLTATIGGAAYLPLLIVGPTFAMIPLGIAQILASIFPTVFSINLQSLRQAMVPDELRGRVAATVRCLVWGGMPVGGILGGMIGQLVPLPTAIGIIAVATAGICLWLIVLPFPEAQRAPQS